MKYDFVKKTYEYDALYRLIKATGRELSSLQLPTHSDFANNIPVPNMGNNAMQNYTQQFTYDELGNIIQMKSVGQWTRDYHYDILHNNYLTGHTPSAIDYTYDEHGNMLKMPHLQSMHYDYQDQLNKVVLDASENTAYYIYDANGQRVRKVIEKTGEIKEERYYLGNYEVYRKFVGITLETERTTVAVADDKRKIATLDKLTVDERSLINMPVAVIRYQYDNHLGSASLELDATAQIISYEEYHPFGSTSYRSGKSETEVSLKRYKYVGKERDEETGLYYYGFRYYAPWIARFINVDPLQHEYPHYTPFQYAGNKPITYVDLDGLEEDNSQESLNENRPTIYYYDNEGVWIGTNSGNGELLRIGVKNDEYVKRITDVSLKGETFNETVPKEYTFQFPSDIALSEIIDVFKRSEEAASSCASGLPDRIDMIGGMHEEASLVMTDKSIRRGPSGDVWDNPGIPPETFLPKHKKDEKVEISIHSHILGVLKIEGDILYGVPEYTGSDNSASGHDKKEVLPKYPLNAIIGRIGEFDSDVYYNDGCKDFRDVGVKIYNDKNKLLFELKIEAIRKILTNDRGRIGRKYEKKRHK